MTNMNDQIQKEVPVVVAWFKRPVPLWAAFVAFLAGAVVSHL